MFLTYSFYYNSRSSELGLHVWADYSNATIPSTTRAGVFMLRHREFSLLIDFMNVRGLEPSNACLAKSLGRLLDPPVPGVFMLGILPSLLRA